MSQQTAHRADRSVAAQAERKIVRLSHERTPIGIKVSGMLEVADHLIPFRYHADHQTPVEYHERYLDTLHAKGVAWVAKRSELADVYGYAEMTGETLAEIVECNLGMFGPHDWRLNLGWKENGQRREMTLHYRDPAHAPGPEKVKEMIRQEAASRVDVNAPLKAHEEALGAIRNAASRG